LTSPEGRKGVGKTDRGRYVITPVTRFMRVYQMCFKRKGGCPRRESAISVKASLLSALTRTVGRGGGRGGSKGEKGKET